MDVWIDMADFIHRTDRILPFDMAFHAGPVVSLDGGKMAVLAGEVGLQMPHMRVGVAGPGAGVGIHRRRLHPLFTLRPGSDHLATVGPIMAGGAIPLMTMAGIAICGVGRPVEISAYRVNRATVGMTIEIVAILATAVVTRRRTTGNLPLRIDDNFELLVDVIVAVLDRTVTIGRIVMTVIAGILANPLGTGQNIMGIAGHLEVIAHQFRVGINPVAMTVGAAGRCAVRPGDSAIRRTALSIAVAIEIIAGLVPGSVIAGLQTDIGLRVDVQALVTDGIAVADGVRVTFGAGKIIKTADMLRMIGT